MGRVYINMYIISSIWVLSIILGTAATACFFIQPFRIAFPTSSGFFQGEGSYLFTGLRTYFAVIQCKEIFTAYGAAYGTAYSLVLPGHPTTC